MFKNERGIKMFVSSYNTYISTNGSNKTKKNKEESPQLRYKIHSSKPASSSEFLSTAKTKIPVDYIAKSKAFYNKLIIQQQEKNLTHKSSENNFSLDILSKQFTAKSTVQNVSMIYAKSAKKFPIVKKPSPTLDQTPKIDKNVSEELQSIQEKNIRIIMINTYIENNKYHAISA